MMERKWKLLLWGYIGSRVSGLGFRVGGRIKLSVNIGLTIWLTLSLPNFSTA